MSADKQSQADELRRRAEELLEKSPEAFMPSDIKNMSEVAQELAVHQAELELQNQELQRTQLELQEARDRFSALYEHAPVGYAVLDNSGIIRRANQTLCDMINQPDADLRGKPFTSIILEDDAPIFLARFRAFFKDPAEKQIIVRMRQENGSTFHARVEARPHQSSEPGRQKNSSEELMVTISDISDLQEARQRIERQNLDLLEANNRETRLNAILSAIRDVNQLITQEENQDRLIREACSTLTGGLSYHSAWIALLDEDEQTVIDTAQSGFNSKFKDLQSDLSQSILPACMKKALQQDRVYVVDDPEQHCAGCPVSTEYRDHASLIYRLAFKGRIHGVLAVSVPAPFARNKEEQGLFLELADDLAFALYKIDITREARQNHQRLQFVIDGARQGTWEWNVQTGETIFNETWASMLGYSIEELQPYSYDTWVELTHPDDLQEAEKRLNQCIQGEQPDYECVIRMRHRNGQWVWVMDRGRMMTYDAEGKPLLMFGTHTDISQHKQIEEELRKSTESLQAILEHSPLLMSEISRDGRYLTANKATADFLGIPTSDLIGASFHELLPQETADLFMERVEHVWNTRQPHTVEDQVDSPEGTHHYLTTMYPLFDSAGEMRSFGSMAHDITERKIAEKAMQQNAERLEAMIDILQYGSEDLQDFLEHALEKALELTGSTLGYIYFYDEERREFTLNSWSSGVMDECSIVDPQTCYQLDKTGIWGEAVRQRKPIILNDFRAEHPLKKGYPEGHAQLHRYLTVPVFHQDRIVAVVGAANKPDDYDQTDILQLTLLMDSVWKTVETMRHEQVLRDRERFLQTILDTTADGFWVIDHQGFMIETNQAYCDMSGYTRDELIGLTISDLDAEENPEETKARMKRLREEGPEVFQTRHRRKDGSIWPVEISAAWMEEENGRFVCFCRDLTDRIQQDERISLLGRMLDDAPAAIMIHNTNGQFLYANKHTVDLHGYASEEDFMTVNLHDLDIPESEELQAERFRQIAQEGSARFEAGHFHKDGSIIPLEVLAKSIVMEGEPTILSIATDITERKRAEQALRASEERFRSYIENSPVGIYISDRNGYLVEVNRTACEDTGYSREELLTMNLQDLNPVDEPARAQELMEIVLNTGRLSAELPFARKDGSLRFWTLNAIRLPNDQIMGFAADITEQKDLEQRFAQAQKMETVGQLAGGVAHDFNNMLSVIMGHLELALEDLDPAGDLYSDLMEAYQSAERSADLTRQLLAFARKQTVAPVVLDLNRTVEGMLSMLERLIGEDIDLMWKPGIDLAPVKMDPSQIDQMLANMCVNARDAIDGNGKITIETAGVSFDEEYCQSHPEFLPGRYTMLAVSDDGCGMDDETLGHLFEPFYTTKSVGEGTGLGLATVYGIVRQNNGFINVYSEPGEGTTFKIYLPAVDQIPQERPPQDKDAATSSGTGTILLVEDEPAILKVATLMLERMGYSVLGASSPGEGLEIARTYSGKIDLLITDVIMPEMNGRELAQKLLAQNPQIRQLFMSGYTANSIAHHGVLDPDVEFIQKPFSTSDLAEKIRSILER